MWDFLEVHFFLLGSYCESPGLVEVTGNCSAGYYCPGGQSVPEPVDYPCPPGDYCPVGSPRPSKCGRGVYNELDYQETCEICPARFYCDPTEASAPNDTGIFDPVKCPPGYYCPEGTETKYQYPCPPGTYSDGVGYESHCKYLVLSLCVLYIHSFLAHLSSFDHNPPIICLFTPLTVLLNGVALPLQTV